MTQQADSMHTPSHRLLLYVKYSPGKSPFQWKNSTKCRLTARNITHVISKVNNRSLSGDQGGVLYEG